MPTETGTSTSIAITWRTVWLVVSKNLRNINQSDINNLDHVPKRGEKDKCLEANNNNFGSFIISKVVAHLLRSPPGTPPFWIDWLLSD